MKELLTDSADYRCPPLTTEIQRGAEEHLGFLIPESYLEMLRAQNGGKLVRRCFATAFPSSWAPDHIEIVALLGVGGIGGMDSATGSRYMVQEWGYPSIGLVIAAMPSGGHDAVMLDYSDSGDASEPRVVYIDEDRTPKVLAQSFAAFLDGLVDCSVFREA